jgi:hypothetical protein
MLIYRVENEKREGPYVNNNRYWTTREHSFSRHHIGINEEFSKLELGDIRSYERCGFDSLRSLYKWFNNRQERFNLKRKGFKVATYRVGESHIRKAKKQLAFNIDMAYNINTEELDV